MENNQIYRDRWTGQYASFLDREINMSAADLPQTFEQIVSLYQEYNILPCQINGYNLELKHGNKRYGDKLNGNLCFLKVGSRSYASIRPTLCYQDNSDLLHTHKLVWDIMNEKSHTSIATSMGKTYLLPNGRKISNFQEVTKVRSNNLISKF